MEIGRIRLGAGEVLFSLMFITGLSMTWIGAESFSEDAFLGSAWLIMGIFVAAIAYGVIAIVEPVNRWVIRSVFAVAFLLSLPIVFRTGLYIGFPAALLGALLAEVGMWRARRVRDALRRPLLMYTARRALPFYFSALSVVLTAVVFISPMFDNTMASPIPDPLINLSVKIMDPLIEPVLGYSIQGSIDEILIGIIEDQLPPGEKVDPRLIEAQRNQYAKQYGIDIKGEDGVSDMLSKILNNRAEIYRERTLSISGDSNVGYFKFGFFLSAFFLFQLLALPLSWITIGFLVPVVSILRGSKAMKMRTSQAPQTKLVWLAEEQGSKQIDEDVK